MIAVCTPKDIMFLTYVTGYFFFFNPLLKFENYIAVCIPHIFI